MKRNRALNKRELALLLVLTLLFLGLVYFRVVYLPVQEQLVEYDTAELEAQIAIEQAKAAKLDKMRKEIAENKGSETGEVATYDNIKNEIDLLNDILMTSTEYHLEWQQPEAAGDTVRRIVSISYTADDYDTALDIIRQIYQSKYRTLIRIAAISTDGSGDSRTLDSGQISVNMDVIFYETLNGAVSTDGLIFTDIEDTGVQDAGTDAAAEDTGVSAE
ncbi:MAG: hypothetical protein U0L49_09155 [Eubacterium sp.]|nr:hypothetical protein [Eubacterium sp.]